MKTVPVSQVRRAVAQGASLPQAISEHAPAAVGIHGLLRLDSVLRAQLHGAGQVLQPLLEEPGVTDVLVTGTQVWVDRGDGLERVPGGPVDPAQARGLATRLAATCGQRLDDASPVVDGTLPDGTRLHAVLPPVSASGTLISLRTQRAHGFSLAELVAAGTVPVPLAPVLRQLVAARANVLVSGATGSGKTTLLASLLSLVSHRERIVCIEEAAELRPEHPHVVHLQVRHPNVQQAGAVTMSALVRAAMRMRPDRLVLGECRGPEVREVLGALNTGHDGGWATVHANTATDVPARLVALGALAGMSPPTVAAQAASALHAVVHLARHPAGRRLTEVAVLVRGAGELSCEVAVRVDPAGRVRAGPGWRALAARLAWSGATPGSPPGDDDGGPAPRASGAARGRHVAP